MGIAPNVTWEGIMTDADIALDYAHDIYVKSRICNKNVNPFCHCLDENDDQEDIDQK
jgi:hypothetical protein